jgi:hypothetical protein
VPAGHDAALVQNDAENPPPAVAVPHSPLEPIATQLDPLVHAMPHEPQFAVSFDGSTQRVPQHRPTAPEPSRHAPPAAPGSVHCGNV